DHEVGQHAQGRLHLGRRHQDEPRLRTGAAELGHGNARRDVLHGLTTNAGGSAYGRSRCAISTIASISSEAILSFVTYPAAPARRAPSTSAREFEPVSMRMQASSS